MGRIYTAVFSGVSVSAVQDLFELTAAATNVVRIHEVHITNDESEVSQQLPVTLKYIPATATSGSGGASVTPRKTERGDAAATTTVERNNTSRATSSGTIEEIRRSAENVLNGWHWIFAPEQRPTIAPSGMMVVGLETAPTGAMPLSGEIVFEEIG